jgi:PAS domain S-box-containing protein
MVAMIAHAIIRHRFMDIRVVIRKGVVYVVAFVAAGTLLTSLIISSHFFFPDQRWRLGREIFLGLVVAALFHPLKSWIQQAFDRYLYRASYDYQRTIREASRVMTTMLDFQSLLAYVSDVISKTIRPELVSIYLRDRQRSDYRCTLTRAFAENRVAGQPETIAGDSVLGTTLRRDRTHLLRDDLRRRDLDRETRAALEELGSLGGDLALPLLKEDQITGFVLLGAKRSGDPYFTEDLDLLSTLASQAAIAVTNAQLYAEVLLVNEYVQNILKTMESGVIAVSVEGEVTLFNSEAERMTGLAATTVRSGPADRLPGALADLIRVTLADGVPRLQAERTLARTGGRETPVVCSTSSFTDAHGRVLGAVLVFSDLTRIKELESEKRRAERLASLEAMTRGIAHEIKNPLVAIKTFAQLLPKKFADQEFRDNFSRVAVREVERIDGLVERLRVLAAPSKALHPLDVREPIEDTLELLSAQLEERQISVSRLYDEVLPGIQGDQAQLKQLFLNLCLNAIESMEPGGALTVRLKTQGAADSATLLVEVVDTGCGIPETLLNKVFDPFFSTKSRGTGLGLAICRGIADAHRATIRAENTPGASGTTIALTFPAAARIPTEVQA